MRRSAAPLPQKSARKKPSKLRYWGDQMTIRPSLPASLTLAVLAVTGMSVGGAPAAEECLARPKGTAPAGKHWYYRTNREVGRKCWFLADAGTVKVAFRPSKRRTPVATIPRDQDIGTSADARAEFRGERPSQLSAVAVDKPQLEIVQSEVNAAQLRDWTVAARWPTASELLSANRVTPINAAPTDAPVAVSRAAAARSGWLPFATAIFLVVIGGAIVMAFASLRLGAQPLDTV